MLRKILFLPAILLFAPLLSTFSAFAEDGWLNGSQIERLFSGNTAATFFNSNGSKALSLFASNHMLITQSARKGNYPFYNGDWYVSEDSLCIKSNSPTVCANVEAPGDHYVGWTQVDGEDKAAFEFQFYKGDPSQLMSGYRTKESRNWVYAGVLAGVAVALLHDSMSGSPQAPDHWGFHGECDRATWTGNPFCGPPPAE